MPTFFKKIIGWLITLAVILFLTILGIQTFLAWKNTDIQNKKLLLKHGANQNLEEQLKEAQERQKVQDDIAKMTQEKLKGYNAAKGGQVLSPHNIKHLGLRNHPSLKCEDCAKPTLIFKDEANEHLLRILNDIISFKQGEELAADGENDPYSTQLKRNNAVLYGAPGTGKTEFINELVHHLYQQFASEEAKTLLQQIRKLEEEIKENEDPASEQIQKLTELKKQITEIEENQLIPPVIEVKGAKLKSAGGITDQPSPDQKLISIIKHYKKEVFGDEFSPEPYIVFVEEADQGVDVMGGTGGKKNYLLEEYKNFLSTSQDKAGLAAEAQDPNSIIIIATNNFDLIDPAVVRRGRLGKKLNFNWTPELLEKYGKEGDDNWNREGSRSEWAQIKWPLNDPAWQFTGNANYPELYNMATAFGYSKFKDEFANTGKANQIIESYKKLSQTEKEAKEKELGMVKGEKGEKVCNWLLHFLYTFHWYNERQNLPALTSAKNIIRYDFGNEFLTREAVWGVYQQVGQEVTQMGLIFDIFKDVAQSARNIKDLMVETQSFGTQIQNLQRQLDEDVNKLENGLTNLKNNVAADVRALEQKIGLLQNSSQYQGLSSRLSTLEGRLSSYGGSSSGSSVSTESVNSLGDKINELQNSLSEWRDAFNNNDSSQQSYTYNKVQTALSNLVSHFNGVVRG
ncbi:MAG: ATPase [Mycoplasmataceae bacterium RV_VA103A]|nr:MAG: ATPase [Mycoplasmataceae bacterium RV_VA103A]